MPCQMGGWQGGRGSTRVVYLRLSSRLTLRPSLWTDVVNMSIEVKIVPASALHARSIARRMRQADRDEVFAASGMGPYEALAYSLRHSDYAWTALVNGRPEVMFGVVGANVVAGVGIPWLLGTEAVERHYVKFLRYSIDFKRQLLARYSVLRNVVDDRNKISIRWLQWLGFTVGDPIDINGYAFRLFELRAD